MFSEEELRATLSNNEVLAKYRQYLEVFGYNEGDKPKDLEEWVKAISEGETKGYSLTSCVLGVMEAAIYSITTPYDEMMRLANEGVIDKIIGAGLDPRLERKLIEFHERADESIEAVSHNEVKMNYEVSNSDPAKLSIEQQFMIRSFETQVEALTKEQAHTLLKDMYRSTVARDAVFKTLLHKQWGLG